MVAPRVAMIVNPNPACGLREHAHYFADHTTARVDFLSAVDPEDLRLLASQAFNIGCSVVHVQHEFSIYPCLGAVTEFLLRALDLGMRTVMDYHQAPPTEFLTRVVREWDGYTDQVVVHSSAVAAKMAEFKPARIPLAVPDSILWPRSMDDAIRDFSPVIGTFGFFRDYKGFFELAQAVGTLRRTIPGIGLVVAGYAPPDGPDGCQEYMRKVQGCPVPPVVIDEFLPVESLSRLLSACDLIVLPYRADSVQQSGAVTLALSSGRPTLVSDSTLFDDVDQDCLAGPRFPKNSKVADIAAAIRQCLQSHVSPPGPSSCARRAMARRRGSSIAMEYDQIYRYPTRKPRGLVKR